MKKRTGVIILVLGILGILGATATIVVGAAGFVAGLRPVAIVEAPGSAELRIEEPGMYALWHDYSTSHDGTHHRYDRTLPHGFTFTLTNRDSGQAIPFEPLPTSTTQTMNTPQRESFGLGHFMVEHPGSYELEATSAGQGQRFISLTQGAFLATFGSLLAALVIGAVLGVLGLGALIGGFIGILAGRKQPAATAPPPIS